MGRGCGQTPACYRTVAFGVQKGQRVNGGIDRRFGTAWFVFAIALAIHVADEATHGFLSIYNPNVLAIRARFPFLPIPTFSFREWILGLAAAIVLLACLTRFAARGSRSMRMLAVALAVLVGIGNGLWHITASIYMHRLMPGVLSAPLLIAAGAWLLWCARRRHAFVLESLNTSMRKPALHQAKSPE
jgi:Protein of unknown function with HXXEE motif